MVPRYIDECTKINRLIRINVAKYPSGPMNMKKHEAQKCKDLP